MEFIGSAENTAGTGAFLDKVAEENSLEVQAQLVERDLILNERLFHTNDATAHYIEQPISIDIEY